MHRNPQVDDVFDAIIELVERIDPPSAGVIESTQRIVSAELTNQRVSE